ncbi:MAG: hypothetical protein AAF485_12435 [Chloroflexota bacterium]
MTNYVLLYTGGTIPESEEEQAAVMAAWGAWYEKMGASVVDGGNPFGHVKKATSEGISDGAVSDPPAAGYTIISAESLDEAAEKVKDHPHINHGGQVTIHETFQM